MGEKKRIEMAKRGYRHRLWGEARNNQRTFLAVSDVLDGPWSISESPIIQPANAIRTVTVNPAVCRKPDGNYLMIVKGDSPHKKMLV